MMCCTCVCLKLSADYSEHSEAAQGIAVVMPGLCGDPLLS